MEVKIVDNFLPQDLYERLSESIVYHANFPLYFQKYVSHDISLKLDKNQGQPWNWYATHELYNHSKPTSEFCRTIVEIFGDRLPELRALMRIKVNFYPHTETLREHSKHVDYDFSSHAAIYSLNTCDGFTRLSDGTKVDSIANRMLFFDGGENHNSSTTTDQMGRYNINFNYL